MMSTGSFSDEFKRDAVAQVTERGYPVSEVSERLGVSKHSVHAGFQSPVPIKGRPSAPVVPGMASSTEARPTIGDSSIQYRQRQYL